MNRKLLKDTLITAFVLLNTFLTSLPLHNFFQTEALVPMLFVLAVFLISLTTDGYYFGVIAALISVLAVNFAFTYPFFELNFTIIENAVSALIMLIVTIVTSMLTTKIKKQEVLAIEIEKEKMRANLLRAISHDLRTPLTTIYGASSTILENYTALADDGKIQLLQGISEDSQWLIRMVENLLSVTKIDNTNVKLIKSSTVLEELLGSALRKFRKRYGSQTVEVSMPDELLTISVDPILIEQVIVNLLENVVQHAHGMTKLSLDVTLHGEKVFFEVADDGCGIAEDRLKSIFSGGGPDNTASADSRKQSMGIGLAVCATIIKAHNGMIWAENISSGGMRFCFALDREESDDE